MSLVVFRKMSYNILFKLGKPVSALLQCCCNWKSKIKFQGVETMLVGWWSGERCWCIAPTLLNATLAVKPLYYLIQLPFHVFICPKDKRIRIEDHDFWFWVSGCSFWERSRKTGSSGNFFPQMGGGSPIPSQNTYFHTKCGKIVNTGFINGGFVHLGKKSHIFPFF